MSFILCFVSDPESGVKAGVDQKPESESEQPHHDSAENVERKEQKMLPKAASALIYLDGAFLPLVGYLAPCYAMRAMW